VIVYDRLVGDDIVSLGRRDAERIFVGKSTRRHAMRQEDINELLVRLARDGKRVARLKGGDPFVFGRGGEEIECLAAARLTFQVVPGITAALGCAAYAGIPLTHRELAHSCLFVTAHQRDGSLGLDWEQLVRPGQTVVVYMGVATLAPLCAGLAAHGLDPATPAALIERGTTRGQRVIASTVAGLAEAAAAACVAPPSLVIIGRVVALGERLAWFDPLTPPASA
jgi:uroporphyrin-III C-methyltransferase / precorrin-2 dehydrogenase / sirohydrochlorin ferrochelatase